MEHDGLRLMMVPVSESGRKKSGRDGGRSAGYFRNGGNFGSRGGRIHEKKMDGRPSLDFGGCCRLCDDLRAQDAKNAVPGIVMVVQVGSGVTGHDDLS
jgi:hypothetical protein